MNNEFFFTGNCWTARKIESTYIVCLNDFSNIQEALMDFAVDQQIKNGTIKGIGTLTEVMLSFSNPLTKEPFSIKFDKKMYFSNIFGKISLMNGAPLFHFETILEGENNTPLTGNLLNAKVRGVNEFFFYPSESERICFKKETLSFN